MLTPCIRKVYICVIFVELNFDISFLFTPLQSATISVDLAVTGLLTMRPDRALLAPGLAPNHLIGDVTPLLRSASSAAQQILLLSASIDASALYSLIEIPAVGLAL